MAFDQIVRWTTRRGGPFRQWEISIYDHPCVVKSDFTGAVLSPQAWAWLEANCEAAYKVHAHKVRAYVTFDSQRDAALFMTFNAGHFDDDN